MLRISEVYSSIQGEGPNVGMPTQFVRFAGCNLRCPGWPCDTQHAIDPSKYRNEWKTVTVDDLFVGLSSAVPSVTLTGGEPILQHKDSLTEFVGSLIDANFNIEVFTNGTLKFPDWIQNIEVQTILDWKLPGTGERFDFDTRSIRLDNLNMLDEDDAIKFVCKDRDDFDRACDVFDDIIEQKFTYEEDMPHIYIGGVWNVLPESQVAEWILKQHRPFKLNVQLHNYIWPAHERAR